MNLIAPQSIVVFAGIINGAFALPSRYIQQWKFEHTWFSFALLAFVLFPCLYTGLAAPATWHIVTHAPSPLIIAMVIGGLAFGIGQCCFAISLNNIGFGLAFLLNIGLGTAMGFSLPLVVLHPHEITTPFGAVTLSGTVLILIGLLFAYQAGCKRDRQQTQHTSQNNGFGLGVTLAIIAGIFSAIQNFTFAFTAPLQKTALQLGMNKLSAATVVWPGFLLIACIPYLLYMTRLMIRNRSGKVFFQGKFTFNLSCSCVMALCWYGSLMLYSYVSILIGNLGPVIAWPLFMVMIILTSNFIGYQQGEWVSAPRQAKRQLCLGIAVLILAFIILALSIKLPH